MDWLTSSLQNVEKVKQLATTVQTSVKFVSDLNQMRQGIGQQQEAETSTRRSRNELTFATPAAIGGAANQNLHDQFSKEFLKEIVKNSPTLLEEPRPTDGCTPLICAVKQNNLDAAIQLLSHGAKVQATDLSGNTALHHAVMARSPLIVKLLLIFRADPDLPNKAGQAANSLKTNAEVAEILSRYRAYSEYGVIVTKQKAASNSSGVQSQLDAWKQDFAIRCQEGKTPEQKANALRLLSLDGGGIRGLILIQILMELEVLSGQPQKKGEKNFVQKNFEWVAGTSTGAILALALADGTPLVECLRLYFRLKDEIFCGFRPYDSECIESFLKQQFGANRKMADLRAGKTKVFVTATKADQNPIKLVLFRNYPSPLNTNTAYEPSKVHIWKAARCSSAAPTYFSSMQGLMDGGLIANNPGQTLLLEVARHIDAEKLKLFNSGTGQEHDVAFLLSLGTGKIPVVDVASVDVALVPSMQNIVQTISALTNLKSILVEQLATSDGQVVEASREMAHLRRVPYFRLTPSLHEDVQLDTVDNRILIEMLWNTKIYMREQCSEELIPLLKLMRDFNRSD